MSAARTRGILGVLTSGDVARSSGRRRARSRSTSSSPSPDPTFPAQWSPSAVPAAEDERAELRPPARSARVADDREVVLRAQLELLPLRRPPPRAVRSVGALRHDALEPLRPCRVEERGAVVERRRQPDGVDRGVEEILEHPSPLLERAPDHGTLVELQQVERDQHEPSRAGLERLEPCSSRVVERAHLAVDHGGGRADGVDDRPRDLAEALREVVAVAARERRLAASHGDDRAVAVPLRLVQPARAGGQGLGERRELRAQVGGSRALGVLAEQQPVPLVSVQVSGHERPDAVGALAVEAKREPSVPFLLEELVRAAVPDLDRSRPVLPGRDHALERRVLERVILDVDGQMALARAERKPLRHRPARERPVPLEPEVVVEAPGVVALDDEAPRILRARAAERLRRLAGVAPTPVVVEARHAPMIPR